jgi:NTP pyrophosphatase (non-canonical NTP hydrolase)
MRTLAELNAPLEDDLHMILGMLTEVGELADVFKKYMAYQKQIDWVNVKEEVGDLLWYVSNFCNINGFDLEEILQTNINKLRARYPEKFTQENAINRDLDKERTILEG